MRAQQTPSLTRRLTLILGMAVAAAGLLLATGCQSTSVATTGPDREEMEDFRQSLIQDSQTINKYLQHTRQGQNVSEFALGWIVYSTLIEISEQDKDLYNFFNKDGHDLQIYLRTTFHDQPEAQVAALDALAQRGDTTLRLIARHGLDSLRHIPDSADPPDVQARERSQLADRLAVLKDLLDKGAREVVLPPPAAGQLSDAP